jgi:uncharacterized protein
VVGRGEVLERMTTVPASTGPLEALWQGGGVGVAHRRPVLLCPPHPRLGGSMDSAVLAELVWQLARRRHPTLRFNHAGVSASHGTIALPWLPSADAVDPTPLVDDARAALRQLQESTGAREVAVVGVSVGALVAARLLLEEDAVAAAALVAPPVRGVLGPGDALDAAALAGTGAPLVVVAGEDDRTVALADIRAVCAGLPLVVVPGADHGFVRGLSACAAAVVRTLSPADDDDDER